MLSGALWLQRVLKPKDLDRFLTEPSQLIFTNYQEKVEQGNDRRAGLTAFAQTPSRGPILLHK